MARWGRGGVGGGLLVAERSGRGDVVAGMRAIRAVRFGGPEVLVAVEAPRPVPAAGEALIEVSYADVQFVDTQIRRGLRGARLVVEPPFVPGCGVAGRVSEVGAGVDAAWVGRQVVAHSGHGGYVEHAVVPAAGLVPVPDELELAQAAALLHDGPSALGLIERERPQAGEWVLVTAAGGGLGVLLVQLAHAAGARVIAAARGARKLALARALGADAAVDYAQPGWSDRVREITGGRGVDVVFDGAGGGLGTAAFAATAPGGRISLYGSAAGGTADIDDAAAAARHIAVRCMHGLHGGHAPADVAGRVLAEAAAGRLRAVVGATFPLEQAAAAHAAIEARETVGRTLLGTAVR